MAERTRLAITMVAMWALALYYLGTLFAHIAGVVHG